MSGGRVELGLGAGWYDAEHAAYGFAFPPVGERFERLEEQFAIVSGLWTTPAGETFDFDGRHFRLQDSPGAAQAGPAAPPTAHRRRRRAEAHAAPRRHLRCRVQPPLLVGRHHCGAVRPRCAPPARTTAATRTRCACRRPRSCAAGATRRRSSAAPPTSGARPTSYAKHGAAGSPDEVVDRLQAFAAIGAQTAYLQVLDLADLEHLDLLAAEVLPRVA